MNFLKSTSISLLSFILFLALSLFSTVYMLDRTLLDPDFVADEINRLDVPALAREMLRMETQPGTPDTTEVINKTVTDLEPWMREQLRAGIYSSYDYFLGKSQRFSLVISLEPLKTVLGAKLEQASLQSPLYQEIFKQMPSSFELNESSLSPQVLAQIRQTKQYIGYFQLGYKALIGLMVLLILGIILLDRRVRSITRKLGMNFLTYGALEYAGIFVAKYFAPTSLPLSEIPQALQSWLPQLFLPWHA